MEINEYVSYAIITITAIGAFLINFYDRSEDDASPVGLKIIQATAVAAIAPVYIIYWIIRKTVFGG